jgi:hypothetical protein
VHFKIVFGGKGKQRAEGIELRNRCKGFIVVNAFYLTEALCYDAGFVFLYGAIGAPFYLEDPLAADNLSAFGARYYLIHTHVLKSVFLIFIG